jgi:hypothetical protein
MENRVAYQIDLEKDIHVSIYLAGKSEMRANSIKIADAAAVAAARQQPR